MSKFIEIEKINKRQEKGNALINLETVVGMCQQPKHFTRLYDEEGNLASETEDTPRYAVLTNCGQTYVVEQAEYDRLKAELTK